MKRRTFGIGAVLVAALLGVAIAASSVSAAPASKAVKTGKLTMGSHGGLNRLGIGAYKPGAKATSPSVASKTTPARAKQLKAVVNNLIGSRHLGKGGTSSGAALAGPPVGTNVTFSGPGSATSAAGGGTSAWLDEEINGGAGWLSVDPSPTVCQGDASLVQVVENTIAFGDVSGLHLQNPESLTSFFAPASEALDDITLNDETTILDHPFCYFDNNSRHWIIAVDALDFVNEQSAILIAVSNLQSPLGQWSFYGIDTNADGGGHGCWGGECYAHLNSLGANHDAIFFTADMWSADQIVAYVPNVSPLFSSNGSSIWALDLTGLILGLDDVNFASWDPGDSDFNPANGHQDDGLFGVVATQSPNRNWNTSHGGTEFFVASWDPLGSLDNTIFVGAVTGTSSISFNEQALVGSLTFLGMTTWYGLPVTDTNCSNLNIGYFVINTISCVDQPPYGLSPLGDNLGFAYGNIPRPINAGDDRVADAKTVTIPNKGPTTIGFVLTTKVIVADANHVNHLRAGTYYAFLHPTGWFPDDRTIASVGEDKSGVISNANNSFIFPSIGIATNANNAIIGMTLTGNQHFPSSAYAKVQKNHPFNNTVYIQAEGQGPYDGLFQYGFFGFGALLFWGDKGAATATDSTVFLSHEYVGSSCSDAQFAADNECGGTRAAGANWNTSLFKVNA